MTRRVHRIVLVAWVIAIVPATGEQASNLRAEGPRARQQTAAAGRTLTLPDVPYRYAELELPPHFADSLATLGFDASAGELPPPAPSPPKAQRKTTAAARDRRRTRRGERRRRGRA